MASKFLFILLVLLIVKTNALQQQFNVVVAQDGSGNFSTISEAIDVAPINSAIRFYILLKKGVYREYIEVPCDKRKISIIGDGRDTTIITGNRSYKSGWRTAESATAKIRGNDFIAQGISFANDAGPEEGQAVALLNSANYSAFYNCTFNGFQDTLYGQEGIQFYRDCDIYGTTDFIFGNGQIVLQNCRIFLHQPIVGQSNVITAQGQRDIIDGTAIILHNCSILAAADFNLGSGIKTYLGRPWGNFSTTVVMQSFLPNFIDSQGWLEWGNETYKLSQLYYAEYNNRGPGANITRRVQWKGYHVITNPTEVQKFTVKNFILGEQWLPSTGIPFILDLI